MIRRKRRASHSNHERWLVSYADFITLLLHSLSCSTLVASRQEKSGRLALAIQVAFQRWESLRLPRHSALDVTDPMPFSTRQAIEKHGAHRKPWADCFAPKWSAGKSRGKWRPVQSCRLSWHPPWGGESAWEIAMHREPEG